MIQIVIILSLISLAAAAAIMLPVVLRRRHLPYLILMSNLALLAARPAYALFNASAQLSLPLEISQLAVAALILASMLIVRARTGQTNAMTHALRHSDARYRAIVDNLEDAVCRYRPDGTLTFVNEAYCRLHNLPQDQLIGRNFLSRLPDDDRAQVKTILARLSVDEPSSVHEHHFITPDGADAWQQWTRHAIFDNAGNLVEIQAVGRDITTLRASEQRMRTIVENLPVMVDAFDDSNRIVMWNRECERVTGYRAEEVIDRPDGLQMLYPDPDDFAAMMRKIDETGLNFRNLEFELTCKNGAKRTVAWSTMSGEHPVPGWSTWAIGIDVTERNQLETDRAQAHEKLERRVNERTVALAAANEQLQREISYRESAEQTARQFDTLVRTCFDALDDVIYVVDRDLSLTLHNAAFARWNDDLGLVTNPLGYTPFELFPLLSEATARPEYEQVIATGKVLITQETVQVGSMRIATETRKIPIRDGDTVTHIVTAIRDITERNATADALRVERDRAQRYLDTANVIMVALNADGAVSMINRAGCELLGYAEDDILGKNWFDHFLPAQTGDTTRALFTALMAGETALSGMESYENPVLTRGGEERLIAWRNSFLTGAGGQPTGSLSSGLDITEQVQARQEALNLAIEQERRVLLAEFVRDTTHEFANPLSVIQNCAYLAANSADPAKQRAHLDRIPAQIRHIEKLIDGLITMSRLDRGIEFKPETVNLNRLIETLSVPMRIAAEVRRHTLTLDLNDHLPALRADQWHLHMALMNIVENAIVFTPKGGSITIRTDDAGQGQVVVEVRDTGIGIPAEHHARIFDRFYRVDPARTERGAGLGLSIARAVVEQHHGSITLESEPGVGSVFRVFLPFAP